MTEGDKAYYRQRAREEMNLARTIDAPERKSLHLEWAQYFTDRIDGKPAKKPAALPLH